MNVKHFAISVIVGFIFVFLYDWLVHGVLLMETYNQTAQLWRPQAEMQQYMPVMLGVQIAIVVVLAWIFTRHYEGKGVGEGIRFGSYMGVLLGIAMAGFYAYMPIPAFLAGAWFAASLVEMIGLGVIFALCYRR